MKLTISTLVRHLLERSRIALRGGEAMPSKQKQNRGNPQFKPPFRGKGVRLVDKGIAREVRILWENGVSTTQSCEGGKGHPFPEPTISFGGNYSDGFVALGIALQHGLAISELRRVWTIDAGEFVGPEWQMTFRRKKKRGRL